MKLEIRTSELRASSPGRLAGYIAKFHHETRIADFYEKVMPGAFTASLSDGRNIIALADHDRRALLGSTANGTLKLKEDPQGLAFELTLPRTTHGNDIAELVAIGEIRGASFGFLVPAGGDTWLDRGDGSMLRELRSVELHEVTITPTPAYANTEVALRSKPFDVAHFIHSNSHWLGTCR
jgi:hypothetical protein